MGNFVYTVNDSQNNFAIKQGWLVDDLVMTLSSKSIIIDKKE